MNNCLECGKPCKRQWCSQACNAKSRKKGKNLICINCEQEFYLQPTDERKGGGKYCSNSCRRAYERKHTKEYFKIGRTTIHRIVAAQKLGRALLPGEVVHHVDGNRHNNHPDNLIVLPSQSIHMLVDPHNHFVNMSPEDRIAAGKKSGKVRREKSKNNHPSSQSLD